MGQRNFKKPFEFHSFSEIFYCAMIRLRNTILNYCGLSQYVKAVKLKKIVGKSLLKENDILKSFLKAQNLKLIGKK